MRVSFDFDGCLADHKGMQKLALTLFDARNKVYIITARFKYPEFKNVDVFKLAAKLSIPYDHIYFADEKHKYEIIKELGIELHFDDNALETHNINTDTTEHPKGVLINFNYSNLSTNDL